MVKFILSLLIVCSSIYATSNDYYNTSKKGYFYYEVEPKPVKKKKKEKIKEVGVSGAIVSTRELTTEERMSIPFENEEERQARQAREAEYMKNIPYDRLDELSTDEYRRLLDTTRDISLGSQNKEYVKAYAKLQKFWVDKSERYAMVWKVANLENPDELTYTNVEWSSEGIKMRGRQKTKEENRFFKNKKDRLGYIVIVESLDNERDIAFYKKMYDNIKRTHGIDYKIVEYFEVPTLVRKLKLDTSKLPEHYFMYRSVNDEAIYKRVSKGYPTVAKILENTRFIFDNVLLEKDKHEADRLKQ